MTDPRGEAQSTVIAAIDKALRHVADLCTRKARWTMSVPVNEAEDSDCVIADALMGAKKALQSATAPNARAVAEDAFEHAASAIGVVLKRGGFSDDCVRWTVENLGKRRDAYVATLPEAPQPMTEDERITARHAGHPNVEAPLPASAARACCSKGGYCDFDPPCVVCKRAPQSEKPAMPEVGDYVLATKYSDGDPGDAWAVGFYAGQQGDRHFVKDGNGGQIRANGFRRVARIHPILGAVLLNSADMLEKNYCGANLWDMLAAAPSRDGNKEKGK